MIFVLPSAYFRLGLVGCYEMALIAIVFLICRGFPDIGNIIKIFVKFLTDTNPFFTTLKIIRDLPIMDPYSIQHYTTSKRPLIDATLLPYVVIFKNIFHVNFVIKK